MLRTIGWIAAAAAVCISPCAWYVISYDDELEAIREALAEIPGVRHLDSGGNEDLTLEDIAATIEIEGKGVVELRNLTLQAFESARRLDIAAAGGLEPRIRGCELGRVRDAKGEPTRSVFFAYTIDVGPEGPFASRLGGGISNVRELVTRIDEVIALLRSLPTCPDAEILEDADGTVTAYSVAPPDSACSPGLRPAQVADGGSRC